MWLECELGAVTARCLQGGALLVDCAMADDDGAVVRRRGEQRVGAVEGHAPHRLLMVSAHREKIGRVRVTFCDLGELIVTPPPHHSSGSTAHRSIL